MGVGEGYGKQKWPFVERPLQLLFCINAFGDDANVPEAREKTAEEHRSRAAV